MQETTTNVPLDQEQIQMVDPRAELAARRDSGANWFFWIAGLSLVNVAILLFGAGWSFIIGLGITEVALAFLSTPVALVVSAGVLSLFVFFGVLARRGLAWAFIIGMILYALDGVLFVLIEDWLSIGFHLFALWGLFGGLRAQMQLNRVARA
jgi:hypothetical protein